MTNGKEPGFKRNEVNSILFQAETHQAMHGESDSLIKAPDDAYDTVSRQDLYQIAEEMGIVRSSIDHILGMRFLSVEQMRADDAEHTDHLTARALLLEIQEIIRRELETVFPEMRFSYELQYEDDYRKDDDRMQEHVFQLEERATSLGRFFRKPISNKWAFLDVNSRRLAEGKFYKERRVKIYDARFMHLFGDLFDRNEFEVTRDYAIHNK